MPFDYFEDNPLIQSLLALGFFVILLVAAGVLYLALRTTAKRLQRRSPEGLIPQVLIAVRNPAVVFVTFLGLYLALISLPDIETWREGITNAWTIIIVLLIGRALAKITAVVINWYLKTVAPKTETQVDDKLLPIVRRMLLVAIYGTSVLIVLDTLGVSISPLLGGLGITGLAVALAMQPTMGNFFAGTYVLSDGAISPGDYIELQGGPSGYVVEVGWRSTKLRTWLNNLVIVPNSVLADTIVINYQAPDPAMNIMVTCGVSYDSDLEKVERVTLEVARQILEECPDAVKEMEPWFGYDNFGDSNIGFWIFMQAKDRIGSFVITNELIKRLHARFVKEDIEINYPVRKLVYANGARPPGS